MAEQYQLRLTLSKSNIMLPLQLIHESHLILHLLLQSRCSVTTLPFRMSWRVSKMAERPDFRFGSE